MQNQIERMRAIIAQALAEADHAHGGRLASVHLIIYGALPETELVSLYQEASRGTPADGTILHIEHAGSRYICWNCCGPTGSWPVQRSCYAANYSGGTRRFLEFPLQDSFPDFISKTLPDRQNQILHDGNIPRRSSDRIQIRQDPCAFSFPFAGILPTDR